MNIKTCCVTGHRDIPMEWESYVKQELAREVRRAIDEGYRCFLSGFAGGGDLYFADAVKSFMDKGEQITLEAYIPYRGRYETLCRNPITQRLVKACEQVHITSERYGPGVYHRRNRFMVERSSLVIAVYDGRERGGTASTIKLARWMEREVRVIEIGRGE